MTAKRVALFSPSLHFKCHPSTDHPLVHTLSNPNLSPELHQALFNLDVQGSLKLAISFPS